MVKYSNLRTALEFLSIHPFAFTLRAGIGADTFNLAYDAENRLVQVQKNGATIAQFTYDADGKRVKSIMGADTILFVGAHYEVKNGSEITQYYLAGTTRVAIQGLG